jgi:hypothetical protein
MKPGWIRFVGALALLLLLGGCPAVWIGYGGAKTWEHAANAAAAAGHARPKAPLWPVWVMGGGGLAIAGGIVCIGTWLLASGWWLVSGRARAVPSTGRYAPAPPAHHVCQACQRAAARYWCVVHLQAFCEHCWQGHHQASICTYADLAAPPRPGR